MKSFAVAPPDQQPGAMLPHREEPDKIWTTPQKEGRVPLEDRAAIPVTIEAGDETSRRCLTNRPAPVCVPKMCLPR
ncbi:hypothetical protein [Accumulibacter sp.]|uniref:hypothetical protein n=1 Tax=Accumulibacter sp. TaxID=2053492 RepID=UPI00263599E4|nr:hypothetical protein [Accumulibacter sp.]